MTNFRVIAMLSFSRAPTHAEQSTKSPRQPIIHSIARTPIPHGHRRIPTESQRLAPLSTSDALHRPSKATIYLIHDPLSVLAKRLQCPVQPSAHRCNHANNHATPALAVDCPAPCSLAPPMPRPTLPSRTYKCLTAITTPEHRHRDRVHLSSS